MNALNQYNGMPVILSEYFLDTIKVRTRIHKSKRINKKWLKRYGFKNTSIPSTKCFVFDNQIMVHPETWKLMKSKIESVDIKGL